MATSAPEYLTASSPRLSSVPRAGVQIKPHQAAMIKKCCAIEAAEFPHLDAYDKQRAVLLSRREEEDKRFPLKNEDEIAKRVRMRMEEDANVLPKLYPYGIISAPVGCGKTYVILALCLLDRYGGRTLWECLKPGRTRVGCTVVVVPSHLFCQWDTAINEFIGNELRVHRLNSYEDIASMFYKKSTLLQDHDIFLVSSLYYQSFATTLSSLDVRVRRLVFDEADSLSKLINYTAPSAFTWFVSASILALTGKNGLRIGSGGQFHVPLRVLQANAVDCDPEFIRLSFDLPKMVEGTLICDEVSAEDDVRTIHRKKMCRLLPRLLQEKTRTAFFGADPQGVEVGEFGTFSHSAFDDELDLAVGLAEGWRQKLLDLRRVEFEEDQHEERADHVRRLSELEGNLNELVRALGDALAAGAMREEDLDEGTKKQRTLDALELSEHHAHQTGQQAGQSQAQLVGNLAFFKAHKLLKICRAGGRKTLVFTQYPRLFYALEHVMDVLGIRYVDLESGGTVEKMEECQRRYTDGDADVLLTHSHMFSCGMNLACTDHVVFVHDVPQELRQQVIGRAQRPGRGNHLIVTTLLYKHEREYTRKATEMAALASRLIRALE